MSRLRLAGHPLHPMLVHFPVALWTLAIAADIAGLVSGGAGWWSAGFGCQALGVLVAMPAMLAGAFDYAALPREHPAQGTAAAHVLVMGAAWLLFLASLALRGISGAAPPPVIAIVAAASGFVAMAVGGWLGGRLVYHFAVGVDARQAPAA